MVSIFLHIKLLGDSILPPILLRRGQMTVRSDLSELEMEKEKECTILTTLKRFLVSYDQKVIMKKYIVMQEYLQIIRKKILIDKLKFLRKRIPWRKSFPTSVLVLILKEKDLKPFWKKYTQELSEKLWLPIRTDFVDLDSNLSNGSLKSQIQNSWFSTQYQKITSQQQMNLQKTYCQSQLSLLQDQTGIDQQTTEGKEKKKNKKNTKNVQKKVPKKKLEDFNSIKLRIYPDSEQKKILNNWFGATRFVYNKCLNYIKNEYKKCRENNTETKHILNLKNLRALFINNINYESRDTWMLDIPYDIRDESLQDLLGNYSSNFAKDSSFDIKFRSKKNINTVSVLKKHWNTGGMYSKVFTSKLKCEQKLPENLDHTCRIKKTNLNKYYICIPKIIKKSIENHVSGNENQVTEKKIISIDPGVRTFITGYDPNGLVIKSGNYDISLLARLLHYKHKLQGQLTKITNHSTRYRVNKALLRLSDRIQNLVDDCHKKLVSWLCKNYNTIIIPRMSFHNFSNMSRKNKNKMIVWKHCSFVDRLINKSREYKDCKIIEVTEEYTSKTCGSCGHIKTNLNSSKILHCNKCLSKIDRDTNGARNILLKYMTSLTK